MFFSKKRRLPRRTLDEIKTACRVLFIDDQKFDTAEILKKAGWNVTRIRDIESLDSTVIRDSHIIFVDIKGVGRVMKFSDEGLGVVSAIKERYPEKKVVLYSSVSEGDRFHHSLKKADDLLSKNADPYQFQTVLERLSKEVFGLEECLIRLKSYMKEELGLEIELSAIKKNIEKLSDKEPIGAQQIAEAFGIAVDKAGSIASVISVLMGGPQ